MDLENFVRYWENQDFTPVETSRQEKERFRFQSALENFMNWVGDD